MDPDCGELGLKAFPKEQEAIGPELRMLETRKEAEDPKRLEEEDRCLRKRFREAGQGV